MKRHVSLEPFSRDHYGALLIAKCLMENRPGAAKDFDSLWVSELKDHFEQEELLLGPLLDAERLSLLRDEHNMIHQLKLKLPESVSELGAMLKAHVRWEERELFPWIETHASQEQLDALRLATNLVEESRWQTSPKRKELVERRGCGG